MVEPPSPLMSGLPELPLPRLAPSTANCLGRQPVRRSTDEIAGSPLYLQRLGATVLPHVAVRAGWLCTLMAVGSGGRLPVGVCTVSNLELQTALVVNPWVPHYGLESSEYLDVWLARVSEMFPSCPLVLERALIDAADRETLQVLTHRDGRPVPELISATRLHPYGIRKGITRLQNADCLVEVEPDMRDNKTEECFAFSIPPSPWPS